MKRKLLMLSAVAICIAILAAGSLAYFTAEDTAHNVITTGGVNIRLDEWADNDKTQPFEDLEGLMPGMEVTKIAEVTNTGAAEAWIRVLVTKNIELVGEGEIDPDLVSLNLNEEFWTLGEDGYYYYNRPLKPAETTEPIFTTVTFDVNMGNEYQGSTATVDVLAQAVQTAHNGDSALDAQGWPANNP